MWFCISKTTGQIPSDWKEAKVIPVYKKGKRNDADNYRPIRILSDQISGRTFAGQDFLPCPFCWGFHHKKELWKPTTACLKLDCDQSKTQKKVQVNSNLMLLLDAVKMLCAFEVQGKTVMHVGKGELIVASKPSWISGHAFAAQHFLQLHYWTFYHRQELWKQFVV